MKYLIIAIIIIAALFYWYQIRPSQIKSFCAEDARAVVEKSKSLTLDGSIKIYNTRYEFCIKSKGL